jgi:hypothetical protein
MENTWECKLYPGIGLEDKYNWKMIADHRVLVDKQFKLMVLPHLNTPQNITFADTESTAFLQCQTK